MKESATPGLQGRMRTTAARLTALARELTVAHGLSGFTVEELCEQAGVSRRTFFNYFATKDDAVFGLETRRDEEAIDDGFLAGPGDGPPVVDHLLDDLVALSVARWNLLDLTPDTASTLIAVFDREPRLLLRLLEISGQREKVEIELVERRHGFAPGDLRAAAAVQLVSALGRAAVTEFLDPANTDDFHVIIERRVAAAREVVVAQHSSTPQNSTLERIR